MSSVTLDSVSKFYGSVAAVSNVSLEVKEGEFLVLLGPSGCGKTTSLRLVAGFVLPTDGQVRIGGKDVTGLPPRKRNTGMVFQNYSLFPNMTVAENIGFGLRERRVDKQTIHRRVGELLELIRLPGIEERYSEELSGGQQQRVALARALAYTPSVLLMDEPLGALDRKLREALQTELHRIQRELGITTIFVTHDQEEAMSLSDRIAVMSDGRIEQIGSPEDLYATPKTAFVADFIGKTNFMTGQVTEKADGRCTVIVEGKASITARADAALRVGQAVSVATRPEAMLLVRDSLGAEANRLPAKVEWLRYLGNIARYFVRTPWGKVLLIEATGGEALFAAGDEVWVVWQPEASLVFPEESPQVEDVTG